MWISTHSLTRRLTVVMAKDVWCSWYFNSQPHKEADTHVCFVYVRGGHFNSQPHKEADQLSHSQLHNLKYISTHSLTRRLTATDRILLRVIPFQLTASQGGWLYVNTYRWNSFHFNSQPHKEADRSQQHSTHFPSYFNSQPHKEADKMIVMSMDG